MKREGVDLSSKHDEIGDPFTAMGGPFVVCVHDERNGSVSGGVYRSRVVSLVPAVNRISHDPLGQLLVISVHDPYMACDSLGPVPGFARYSAGRRECRIAQKLCVEFSDLRSRLFCVLGPAGSENSSF